MGPDGMLYVVDTLNDRVQRFGPDGRLWFIIEDSGEQHLARIRVDGRGLERVVTGERVVGGYHIGGEGRIALELSDLKPWLDKLEQEGLARPVGG